MKKYRGNLTAIGVAALAAVVITACGSAASPAGSAGSPAPASSPAASAPAAANGSDIAFARTVVILDGQAGTLASLAARHAASSQVRAYALQVRSQARASEHQAADWLRARHQSVPAPWAPGSAPPYWMGPGMMGMPGWSGYWAGMGRGWHALTGMYGPAFDTAWTAMMARSYSLGIAAAHQELLTGTAPWARDMAGTKSAWWQAGMTRLHTWCRNWGGPNWNQPNWWSRWNGWSWHGWNQAHPGSDGSTRSTGSAA
jgi:uncharacterized protein (DUF305 family)